MASTAAAEAAPPKNRKKAMIVGAAVVVALAGGYLKFGKSADPAAAAVPGATPTPTAPAEGEIVEVGTLTVNLAAAELHYARVGFSVVLAEGATADVVSPRFPLLKDAAITQIGSSSPEALVTPAGVDDLRARLTTAAQEIYPPDVPGGTPPVLRVVLTELVIQ